ncbi:hypothetical protein CHUAL_007187 [Chamberlinius hualienensis]
MGGENKLTPQHKKAKYELKSRERVTVEQFLNKVLTLTDETAQITSASIDTHLEHSAGKKVEEMKTNLNKVLTLTDETAQITSASIDTHLEHSAGKKVEEMKTKGCYIVTSR